VSVTAVAKAVTSFGQAGEISMNLGIHTVAP
jgi:hypothetical protein